MRKMVALILATVLACSIGACGKTPEKKNSGVNIDELQSAIREFDEQAVVRKSQGDDGYTFNYSNDDYFGVTVSGTADANEMLTSVVATATHVNAEYLKDLTATQFIADMANSNNVAMNKLAGEMLLVEFSYIAKLLSPEDVSSKVYLEGLDILLNAIKTPQTSGNWKYTVTTNISGESATIKAQFIDE